MRKLLLILSLIATQAAPLYAVEYLKQSTSATIKLGPFLDDADGKTAESALTLSQADFRLSKNGGDFAQKNDSTSATHDELGYYDVPLNSTDTGTLGRLLVAVQESGALPVWKEYLVVPANVYDSLVSGSDLLDANASQLGGTAQTGRDIGASVLLSPGTGTGQISLSSGAVTAGTVSDKTGYTLSQAFPSNFASLGINASGHISRVVLADTVTTATTATNLTNAPTSGDLTVTMKASVNAEVLDVLSTDTFGEPTGTPGATLSLREKIGWIFMALRNGVTVSGSKKTFLDDGGAGEWSKPLSDDGTTYTEGEATAP